MKWGGGSKVQGHPQLHITWGQTVVYETLCQKKKRKIKAEKKIVVYIPQLLQHQKKDRTCVFKPCGGGQYTKSEANLLV